MNEFDFDYTGEYDTPTWSDYERWENEKLLEQDRSRREQATEEELNDPYFDVPF